MALSATENRNLLEATSGRLNLPAGDVAIDEAALFTSSNAGLFLTGNGTTLASPGGDWVSGGGWVSGRAVAIRPGSGGVALMSFYEPIPAEIPPGQVGWLFNGAGSDGLGFYPAECVRVLPGPVPASKTLPHFMRAYKAVPFTGIRALIVPQGHGLKAGDDVFATDGVLINEIIPEWRKVTAVGGLGDAVMLDRPLTRTYRQGTLVSGPVPHKLSFQGLRMAGSWGPVLVQQATDIAFADCLFEKSQGWVSVVGSGRVSFTNCTLLSGLQSSASHDVTLTNCMVGEVQGEQAAYNFKFSGCRFGPGGIDSKTLCTGWQLTDCITHGYLMVYDSWLVDDHIAYGPVVVRGRNAVVRDLWSAEPVRVSSRYQGQPDGAGTGVMLDGIIAPSIHLEPGTSGTIRRRSCPVTGDPTGWAITPALK